MPLESLSNEQINIHDLTLEQEKKPESEWREQYEALKQTQLYDPELQQWNFSLKEDQSLQGTTRSTDAQLLGIVVESKLDKDNASHLFEVLKKTPLYAFGNRWYRNMDKNQKVTQGIDTRCDSADQLLGVLVQSQIDKSSAQIIFQGFKETKFYNKSVSTWKDESLLPSEEPRYNTDSQLIGVILEAQFDQDLARKRYNSLKETQIFNRNNNRWFGGIYRDSNGNMHRKELINAKEQLLGVLAEAQFDKDSAKTNFEDLKKTDLYDPERKQWNYSIDTEENPRVHSGRNSVDQLLGILCEQAIEEPNTNLETPTMNLPETRRY